MYSVYRDRNSVKLVSRSCSLQEHTWPARKETCVICEGGGGVGGGGGTSKGEGN